VTARLSSKTLADGLEDGFVFDVISVIGLQLGGNASERSLEGLLGGSVDHLGLNASIIRGPGNEGDLVSDTIARGQVVLEVVNGVTGTLANGTSSALGGSVDERLTEVLPLAALGGLLDNNLLVVVRELVDDELVLLVKLQVVESSNAFLRNGGSIVGKQSMRLARVSQNLLPGCCVLPRGGRHNHDRGVRGDEQRSEV
jgi:hypothetical protein